MYKYYFSGENEAEMRIREPLHMIPSATGSTERS